VSENFGKREPRADQFATYLFNTWLIVGTDTIAELLVKMRHPARIGRHQDTLTRRYLQLSQPVFRGEPVTSKALNSPLTMNEMARAGLPPILPRCLKCP
jgi:hypothetical protein